MRESGQDIKGIHRLVGLPSFFDLFDIGDVQVEDIIFFNRIVDQVPTGFIQHQDFPIVASRRANRVQDNFPLDGEE